MRQSYKKGKIYTSVQGELRALKDGESDLHTCLNQIASIADYSIRSDRNMWILLKAIHDFFEEHSVKLEIKKDPLKAI